jgi:hypothetical protein
LEGVVSETLRARLVSPQQAHAWITSAYQTLKPSLIAGHAFDITIKPETRSNAANRRMWAMLRDISQQVVWHGQKLAEEDWKNIFSASLKKQRVVPGIDGGFVVMGQHTSKMSRAEMSELQELMQAFGDERSVLWSEPVPEYAA